MPNRPPQLHTVWVLDSNGNALNSVNGGLPVTVLNAGSGGTASTFGAAFPVLGTAAGAQNPSANMVPLEVDASGNLLVNLAAGSVTVAPVQSNTVSAPGPTTIGASSVQLLAANALRKRVILQNVGTTKLYILFGAGSASATNYHIALPAGGTTNDGSSPIYSDAMWTGAIQAISAAAGGSVQVGEFT